MRRVAQCTPAARSPAPSSSMACGQPRHGCSWGAARDACGMPRGRDGWPGTLPCPRHWHRTRSPSTTRDRTGPRPFSSLLLHFRRPPRRPPEVEAHLCVSTCISSVPWRYIPCTLARCIERLRGPVLLLANDEEYPSLWHS